MVTIRTYWSLAEAALAKSLLDNYEIPAALLDENASLYNRGAQFAVPVRLVVDETEVERAAHILNAEFEKADEIELRGDATSMSSGEPENANRNPWELLVLAFYLFVPSVVVLSTKYPLVTVPGPRARYWIAKATVFHFLSWLAVILAAVLIGFYFRVRRDSVESRTK
jgi:Putative prokaryotic signal transducing protein